MSLSKEQREVLSAIADLRDTLHAINAELVAMRSELADMRKNMKAAEKKAYEIYAVPSGIDPCSRCIFDQDNSCFSASGVPGAPDCIEEAQELGLPSRRSAFRWKD